MHLFRVTITGAGALKVINVKVNNFPVTQTVTNGFTESGGIVSIEAEHYRKAVSSNSVTWQTIPHLGRTMSGVTTFPVTADSSAVNKSTPHLEYRVYLYDTGAITVHAYLSPTLPFHNQGLRYAVSIDEETPRMIDMNEGYSEARWRKWVSDAIIDKTSLHHVSKAGVHVLKFWRVDAGVVLQKLVIDAGGLKESYLGPEETKFKKSGAVESH